MLAQSNYPEFNCTHFILGLIYPDISCNNIVLVSVKSSSYSFSIKFPPRGNKDSVSIRSYFIKNK